MDGHVEFLLMQKTRVTVQKSSDSYTAATESWKETRLVMTVSLCSPMMAVALPAKLRKAGIVM